ncbi:tRNA (adenine(22)-N(1))-methyltransferase [Pseudoalteromonas luteoviolacea]|uniref:tRNA (adenine(22)-N(1))-methyltransferase n=1 Tax=Pseudoalteromonas luteoviolacea TaxID=43657 RepID=UPI001B39C082|nr:tRNA (adenine(22)-N(1))-methyltransferase TrmK [Pseudoalteromonas luteoviolacea]MBQ4837255.1 tRNA (adenine(22)-N(1))-methyltransferase TrmK [Pseudoalteromonas luteoviolacea]
MKLGKRLAQISALIEDRYTHIWDCCCDHGLLGADLLNKDLNAKIHFVDIVPHLIQDLEVKLQQFYPHKSDQWQTHCLDVAKLPLSEKQGKHLVIIAGVGGDLCSAFVKKILIDNPNADIEFVLCPVHHLYALRQDLSALKLHLIDEVLVKENNRHYELLKLSNKETNQTAFDDISPVGEKIWYYRDEQARAVASEYLSKTIAHYKRIDQGGGDVSAIVAAYENVELIAK